MSIDAPDKNAYRFTEDLSVNDQESIVELVLEQVMGFENAMPEYDDPDHNFPLKKKAEEPTWNSYEGSQFLSIIATGEQENHYPFLRLHELGGHYLIITPPPQLV